MQRYNWDTVPREAMGPLIVRQVIHTPDLTLLRGTFKQGAIVALHQHVHEQVTNVLSGRMRLEIEGEAAILTAGECARIPSNLPHAAEALEDTVVLDVFTPARTDWQ
jgi:quercetin dioxygenase-like cupin family protein